MKKLLTALVGFVMLFSLIACGEGGNGGNNNQGKDSDSVSFNESDFIDESLQESFFESEKLTESEKFTESEFESETESETESESSSESESESDSEDKKEPTDIKWFKFVSDGSGYSVAKCEDYDEKTYPTEIVIPNVYNGKPVTSIEDNAFEGCVNLTNVTIPDSVTHIGSDAFDNCNEKLFTEVGGVKYIDKWVVGVTYSWIASVSIKSGTYGIADRAFSVCANIANIKIPNSVIVLGDYAFSYCNRLTSVEIPSSVTSIGDGAFEGCSGLANVALSNSITSIGRKTFHSCSSLTSVEIPDGVTSIEYEAFRGCGSLISVTIPDSVISIGCRAFDSCNESLYEKDGKVMYVDNWVVDVTGSRNCRHNVRRLRQIRKRGNIERINGYRRLCV